MAPGYFRFSMRSILRGFHRFSGGARCRDAHSGCLRRVTLRSRSGAVSVPVEPQALVRQQTAGTCQHDAQLYARIGSAEGGEA
jgi:hypothetical protein